MAESQNNNIQNAGSGGHSDKTILGFWVYLMTDLIMFAAMFATYAALRENTFGGKGAGELLNLSGALAETFILLTSSFTCGLAMLAVHKGDKSRTLLWFWVTFVLGFVFLSAEVLEFRHLAAEGHSYTGSAFLSSFFALVGMHGAHIALGLLWLAVSLWQVYRLGLTPFLASKLMRLSLFWHFLDLVWIFIFTIVYLMAKV